MTDRTDRGSISVELAVLAPAFALLFALVVGVGRLQSTRADIEAAAHSAARSITLSRHPSQAAAGAEATSRERLQVGDRSCRTMDWDTHDTATEVTVTIVCEVDLADLALLPVQGSIRVRATATEVFDTYVEEPEP